MDSRWKRKALSRWSFVLRVMCLIIIIIIIIIIITIVTGVNNA